MAGGRVELVSLTKRFTEIAVDNIDLQIASGEFFSLLGPSGCGKTTTLRLIAGFEQPTSGRILLDDVDVSAVPPHKRNVNTVFQSYALFPFLTVYDNVAFGLRNKRLAKAELDSRVYSALELVHLRQFEKRRPGQLSGGQQQRVAIVRALAMKPQIMLLDEVTSALDPELVADVLDVIRELAEGGMTMLIATHEMGFARDIASRVCFLADGQIVEQAPPARLFSEPSDERTRRFLRRIVDAGRL